MTLSRSSIVNTVSRCMWARSFVITTAITRSAAPLLNRACATCSIIRAVVRSLIPISTVPLPMGCTSPPSSDDLPKSSTLNRPSSPSGGYQYSKSASREHRVVAVDRGHVVGLQPPSRPEHRVDGHSAVDPARRVASEQSVRQRRQHENAGVVHGGTGQGRGPQSPQVESGLGHGQAADEVPGELFGLECPQGCPYVVDQRQADGVLRHGHLDQPATTLVAGRQRLTEQGPATGRPRPLAPASSTTNWSCSYCARSTHSTSSNSSSSWLVGVSRCRLSSGLWTITLRSRPTSEWTPNDDIASPFRTAF